MKYKIKIQGMHCSGCENLIKVILEDEGLENATVDMNNKEALFESNKDIREIDRLLFEVFSDLEDYSFSNLQASN